MHFKYNNRFFNAIQLTTSLQKLKISSTSLDTDKIKLIGKTLKYNKSIKYLNLEDCFITDIKPIADSLKRNTTLQKLNLYNNFIIDLDEILNSLQYNKTLLKLNIGKNISNIINHYSLYGELITKKHESFDIYGSKIKNALKNMLIINNSLQELNLSKNNFKTLLSISDGLQNNNSLKVLNLNYNKFNEINPLCEVLLNNTCLEKLYLCKCFNINSDFDTINNLNQLSSILDNRKSKCKLKYLQLIDINDRFNFTNDDIQLFINSLKNNKYLKELILFDMDFINNNNNKIVDYKVINNFLIGDYDKKIKIIHDLFNTISKETNIKINFINNIDELKNQNSKFN